MAKQQGALPTDGPSVLQGVWHACLIMSQKRSMVYRIPKMELVGKMMITWETTKFGNTQCSKKTTWTQTHEPHQNPHPVQDVIKDSFLQGCSWSSGYVAPTHSPAHLAALIGGRPQVWHQKKKTRESLEKWITDDPSCPVLGSWYFLHVWGSLLKYDTGIRK